MLETASNPKNYLGIDNHGNHWHAQILSDGTQAWTSSRSGEIRNGGINTTPITYSPETGLNKNRNK